VILTSDDYHIPANKTLQNQKANNRVQYSYPYLPISIEQDKEGCFEKAISQNHVSGC
jgi:hypothetical protein